MRGMTSGASTAGAPRGNCWDWDWWIFFGVVDSVDLKKIDFKVAQPQKSLGRLVDYDPLAPLRMPGFPGFPGFHGLHVKGQIDKAGPVAGWLHRWKALSDWWQLHSETW